MEKLQGPIHPYFLEEHFGMVECLEEEMAFLKPSFEDKTPFLQMLQTSETTTPFLTLKDPNFQTLLKLQHLKYPWEEEEEEDIIVNPYMSEIETQVQCTDFESCITLKSEIPPSHEVVITSKSIQDQDQDQDHISGENCCSRDGNSSSSTHPQTNPSNTHLDKPSPNQIVKERKKRKRTKASKNKEEVETQRMTHIAVERNRRRQMNDHLNSLRSLMPPSYIQRGDQASIIGGAIDFVKELEQLLQSLEAQKRMRKPTTKNSLVLSDGLFSLLPEYKQEPTNGNCGEQVKAEHKSSTAEIEVTVIQNHVNLKIQCSRRNGLLLKAIASLEDLRLTVLHLNITSFQAFVLYSLNLKMEDGCNVGSADEIAATVDRIFK